MSATTNNAIAVRVPLQYIVTGILSLTATFLFIFWKPEILSAYHYNQYVIGITHLFIFGWLASVVMGAMYQLVPVALETQLHSEKIARRAFWIHLVGFIGIVWTFWVWNMKGSGYFGSLLAVGIGMFVYNIARTLRKVPRWNVIAYAITASLFWLSCAVLAGLYVACAKLWDFSPFGHIAQMHAHAHLGVVGFFLQVTLGVSYKLIPMFTLSEIQSQRRAKGSLLLLNIGLLGAFVGILVEAWWKEVFAVVSVIGIVLYGIELIAIVRARKRKAMDWGVRFFLSGMSLLIPVAMLSLVLSWPGLTLNVFTGQLENLYGFIALAGVLTFAILGMLHKIVPFLVWLKRYSPDVGRRKVPSVAEMYSTGLQKLSFWMLLVGFLGNCVGILLSNSTVVRASSGLMLVGLVVVGVNLAKILAHLRPAPMPKPLTAKEAVQQNAV
ncbi:MAG: hypothetical protein H0X66_17525 [Verrucomicrobia bacterium]|nr:hypothetical protein [Verrucomicrobiota bacterium]